MALVVRNPPATAGDLRDAGLIHGSGRSPGGGHGNPLRFSCLENPMGRGAWQPTVHKVAKSQTQLKELRTHTNKARNKEVWGRFMKKEIGHWTREYFTLKLFCTQEGVVC